MADRDFQRAPPIAAPDLEVQVIDGECAHDVNSLSWFARASSISLSTSASTCGVGSRRERINSSKMRVFRASCAG